MRQARGGPGPYPRDRIYPAPIGTVSGWYDPAEDGAEDEHTADDAGGEGEESTSKPKKNGHPPPTPATSGRKRKRGSITGIVVHPVEGSAVPPAPLSGHAVDVSSLPPDERQDFLLAVELSGWRRSRAVRTEYKGETVEVALPAKRRTPPRRVGADDVRRRRRSGSDDEDDEDEEDEEDELEEDEEATVPDRKRQRKASITTGPPPGRNGATATPTPTPSLGPSAGPSSGPLPPPPGPRGKTVRTNIPQMASSGVPRPAKPPALPGHPPPIPPIAKKDRPSAPATNKKDAAGLPKKERDAGGSGFAKPSQKASAPHKSGSSKANGALKQWEDDDMAVDDESGMTGSPHGQPRRRQEVRTLEDARARAADVLGWTHLPAVPVASNPAAREAYAAKLTGRLLELVEDMRALPLRGRFAQGW